MTGWFEGALVMVKEPKKVGLDWLLPGERAYVLEIRDQRARVRCPATGVDGWVDTEELTVWERQR